MRRHAIPIVMTFVPLAILLLPLSVFGQDTGVTGSGAGTFPGSTTLSGVSVSGLQFGMSVYISDDGSAEGDFQATLLGTSILGLPQYIEVQGEATGGFTALGIRTFSGIATVNMGNGTPALTNVPIIVTATPTTMLLTIGITNLPALTLTGGTISIE
jgi:hypothetical protein